MGDEADWIVDQILNGGYWDDRREFEDGDDYDFYPRRRKGPPPRPETLSMFDDLDTREAEENPFPFTVAPVARRRAKRREANATPARGRRDPVPF